MNQENNSNLKELTLNLAKKIEEGFTMPPGKGTPENPFILPFEMHINSAIRQHIIIKKILIKDFSIIKNKSHNNIPNNPLREYIVSTKNGTIAFWFNEKNTWIENENEVTKRYNTITFGNGSENSPFLITAKDAMESSLQQKAKIHEMFGESYNLIHRSYQTNKNNRHCTTWAIKTETEIINTWFDIHDVDTSQESFENGIKEISGRNITTTSSSSQPSEKINDARAGASLYIAAFIALATSACTDSPWFIKIATFIGALFVAYLIIYGILSLISLIIQKLFLK